MSGVQTVAITPVAPPSTGPGGYPDWWWKTPRRPPPYAPTVNIARTHTGPPGSPARVANLGDPRHAFLAFSIPRGHDGCTGARGYPGADGRDGIPGPPGPPGPSGTGQAIIAATPPTGVGPGVLWFNPNNTTLSIWTGLGWVAITGGTGGAFPEAPPDGRLYMRQGSTASWLPLTLIDGGTY